MDADAFQKVFGTPSLEAGVPTPTVDPTEPNDQQPAELTVDPQQAQSLWDAVTQGLQMGAGSAAQAGSPTLPEETVTGPNATDKDKLDAVSAAGAAVGTGGLKSVFETKDFLFGDTPREEQSAFRQTTEDFDQTLKAAHPILNGLASGIGQFTVAMVGLGKIGMVAKALPWVGEGVAAIEGLKGGSVALESGKAALAGAIAFDPHEARLSNLIQDTPLANPFNAWLAAKPGDSAAMGRLKNAMESLGMDAALIGTFTGGLRIWRYLKEGRKAEASRAVTQLETDMARHIAQEQQGANAPPPNSPEPSSPDLKQDLNLFLEMFFPHLPSLAPWQQDWIMKALQKPRRHPVMCRRHGITAKSQALGYLKVLTEL
ncbi:hypothetical protein [Rhizobium leguminosarum]